jgi:hypothetical protein
MRYECNACKGRYEDPQPDGARYFHACPPVPLSREDTDSEDDSEVVVEWGPRPDHRDENVIHVLRDNDPAVNVVEAAELKSHGAGRRELGRSKGDR